MERLIAWYRVGSSVGAVVALLVANAIPLVGVLFLGWNVWTILTIYWLENGVLLETGLDLGLHLAEHREVEAAGSLPAVREVTP
jgi:hypothetical protein